MPRIDFQLAIQLVSSLSYQLEFQTFDHTRKLITFWHSYLKLKEILSYIQGKIFIAKMCQLNNSTAKFMV